MNLSINKFGSDTSIKIIEGVLTDEVVKFSKNYDLLIMGVSLDWGIKKYATGFRSDEIIEKTKCSVMVVKAYHNILQRKDFRRYVHRLRELIHKA